MKSEQQKKSLPPPRDRGTFDLRQNDDYDKYDVIEEECALLSCGYGQIFKSQATSEIKDYLIPERRGTNPENHMKKRGSADLEKLTAC